MAIYAYDAIMTIDEMVGVMLADPRLLHVGEGEARNFLNLAYDDDNVRLEYTEDAIPECLLLAHRQGKTERLYVARETLSAAMSHLGVLCCICGCVNHKWPGPATESFVASLTPRVTQFAYESDGVSEIHIGATPAACVDCYNLFQRGKGVRVMHRGTEEEIAVHINGALARLIDNPRFQQRIAENASRWGGLRFHPREAA